MSHCEMSQPAEVSMIVVEELVPSWRPDIGVHQADSILVTAVWRDLFMQLIRRHSEIRRSQL